MAYDGERRADNGASQLNGDERESVGKEPTFRAFWADVGGLPKESDKTPAAAYAHRQWKEVFGVRPELRCARAFYWDVAQTAQRGFYGRGRPR
jgi:hypothetical protein